MNLYRINDNGERIATNVIQGEFQKARRTTPTPGESFPKPGLIRSWRPVLLIAGGLVLFVMGWIACKVVG